MQAELEWGEGEVKNQIEGKREGDEPWDLPGDGFIKYRTERNRDNRIQDCPNRPKNPSRGDQVGLIKVEYQE